jgi:prepilin-type N-terminal cleavage/methylation domain-containing protein/prepilin-type processing-associated H-X9-DG protein
MFMHSRAHGSGSSAVVPVRLGFTLTDLSVALAILSVLAAIVVPMVIKAKANAKLGQCVANLQQVGRAVLLYAEEHKGTLPLIDPSPPPGGWWYFKEQVKGYAGLSGVSSAADKVFACPSDRGYGEDTETPQPFWSIKKYDYTSYVFNGVNLPGVPNIAGWPLASVRDPSKTLLVMEWTAHAPLSWHKSQTGKANSPFYNDAESVVAFADGHVKLTRIHYDGMNAAYTRDPIGGYDYKYSGD